MKSEMQNQNYSQWRFKVNKKQLKKMSKSNLVKYAKGLNKFIRLQQHAVCSLNANIEELEYDNMELQAENIELGDKLDIMMGEELKAEHVN